MKARLPDAKFFQFPEDNELTLVQVRRNRCGGVKDYHLVRSAAELAELVIGLSPQDHIAVMSVGNHLTWEDQVYMPDKDGNLNPGAY